MAFLIGFGKISRPISPAEMGLLAVRLANKTARIALSLLAHGTEYELVA